MIALPAQLAPPAPFPLVVSQWSQSEEVAPGMRRADYRLTTSAGPLVVHVVEIDTHDPSVRLEAVLAHDRLISSGETVSSMAARTGAVAGINADYFDIGNTNQPLNVVVQDGLLVRTPSKRGAIEVLNDGRLFTSYVPFTGSATIGGRQIPLTAVNEWPPQGGASLLTPAYGTLKPAPGVLVATLMPLGGVAGAPGTYRVTAVGPATAGPVHDVLLALGPAAQGIAPPPAAGDTVTLAFDTEPPAAQLHAAVGGGPLLVISGLPFDDAQSPAPEETKVRFPLAGAAYGADGSLFLIAVDGRKPQTSIGLTRPEFGALMLGFGVADGIAFDSGGSATLVARELGTARASVVNDPSDGRERPVADALLAYSDAPTGAHPRLVVRPEAFTAYRGARIALHGAIVDDGDHVMRAANVAPFTVDPVPGPHVATVRETGSAYTATVSYTTVDRVAALAIAPDRPNPPPGAQLTLTAAATDARGAPVLLGNVPLTWSLGGRSVTAPSVVYDARNGDARVNATLGTATATTLIRVGTHTLAVPGYPETVLAYDFTGNARAAYARTTLRLPDEPVRFSVDVFGDGSGVPLRASFVNRYGEPQALTLAPAVNWTGWRRLTVPFGPEFNPPVTLTAIYVVRSLNGPPVDAAGTLRFRALAVVVPGSS